MNRICQRNYDMNGMCKKKIGFPDVTQTLSSINLEIWTVLMTSIKNCGDGDGGVRPPPILMICHPSQPPQF